MTKKVVEFPKPQSAAEIAKRILVDPDISSLDTLERNVDGILRGRAEYRLRYRGIGREPPPLDDGIEERALLIREMILNARDRIKQNQAGDAVEYAVRAAYLLCELSMLDMDHDDLEAVRESIRLAGQS